MPLSSQLSFKSWTMWALVATTPNPYWDMMALSTSVPSPLPKSTRELSPVVPWPRDPTLISDSPVFVFDSLSFKYPALDLPGYRSLTQILIPVHPR